MEDDVSRKLVISVIAILVIILVTNNFVDLTGQATTTMSLKKSVATGTCYDSDYKVYDSGGWYPFKGGSASGNLYGSFTTLPDYCWSGGTLMEAYCQGGYPTRESATCTEGCVSDRSGAYCKQAPITQASKKILKKR